jgi:hypothetical protein
MHERCSGLIVDADGDGGDAAKVRGRDASCVALSPENAMLPEGASCPAWQS